MVLVVKIVSIAIIVYGCLIVLRPTVVKEVLSFVKEENRFYIASGTKAFFGILFLIAAKQCAIPWIIFLFGALSILGGAIGLIMKKKAIDKFIQYWEGKPTKQLSVLGIVALVIGILLVLAV